MAIYFSSDLHFSHDKHFIYEPRGFPNITEMNETIVKNFNSIITNNDDLYLLGDCILGNSASSLEYLQQLNGKIHIILGNHDTSARIELYKTLPNVIDIKYADVIKYNKCSFYLSHYPTMTANLDEDAPLKTRVINLCGHSHIKNRFKDMDKGLIYHVEIDCHNNFPILLDEILFDINNFISMDKSDQIDIIKKDIY